MLYLRNASLGRISIDDFYHAFRHPGLGGDIPSPILKHDDTTIVLLSQKTPGHSSDKHRIVFIRNNQTGEREELLESGDGQGQWDLSPCAITYGFDRSLLIPVEEKGGQVLYKLRLAGWWPDRPTPASLELLSGFLLNQESVVDVVVLVPPETSRSKLLLSCEALNHIISGNM